MSGRHYSEFPFKSRPESRGGGPQDEIEWEALRHLKAQPEVPFQRFVDGADGERTLIYATARVMQESCVSCHNNHPDSTKDDWQVGDVRGVLKIVRPLDQDVARTRVEMRSSFVLVGVVSVVLLGLCAGIAMLGDRRSRAALRPKGSGEVAG